MIHKLKIEPQYLENLLHGRKKSEIRLNDRDYQIGDLLEFPVFSPKTNGPSVAHFAITHIHSGLGLLGGYVVMSVERVDA
jgi:hypothetical protein